MGTIDYWFEQDQRVFTNIREVIDLAKDEDGNIEKKVYKVTGYKEHDIKWCRG